MKKHIIILAGGGGTRLWPASHTSQPKQFLDFGTGLSLYQRTLDRALRLKDFASILIVTHQDQVESIRLQSKDVLKKQAARRDLYLLPEPEAKNTAAAIAYACAWLKAADAEPAQVAVLPADHLVKPLNAFQADMKKALELASGDLLVTFGIRPDSPETGYGYIKSGGPIARGYRALEFMEKPGRSKAETLLKDGNYFWNSGIFVFKTELFMQELLHYKKEIAGPFLSLDFRLKPERRDCLCLLPLARGLRSVYKSLPAVSIDTALMEKSGKRAMVKASFHWSDVGGWDQVALNFTPQGQKVILTEAKNNFVFSDLPVALVGVEDLHVIVKNNVVLVCKKGNPELVKKTVGRLPAENLNALL